jgi:hypothetical protein
MPRLQTLYALVRMAQEVREKAKQGSEQSKAKL